MCFSDFVGVAMFVIGFAFGARVLLHYLNTGEVSPYLPSAVLSALLIIFGFQVIVTGMVAELLKRNRKVQEQALYIEKEKLYSKANQLKKS